MTQTMYPDEAMATTFQPVPTARPTKPRGVRRVLVESGYSLSAFPIALVAFIVVLVDLTLGVALSIFIGGVLLIAVGVMVARGFARFERIRLRGMLGRSAPTPTYICAPRDAGFWRRQLTPLRDPQSWLDVVWSLTGLVTGTVAFAVTLAWWAGAAGGLTYWFWQRWLPENPDDTTLAELIGLGEGQRAESWLNLAIGAALLLTLPWVVRLVTTMHASLAWVLLSSRAELQGEVARVEGGRDAARMAEAESLRRLERDIHDGPQQRLVRLTMDLGRAKKQVADDPERAAETLDAALAQARETVAELRSLSRGIAPPLLVDRGLAAALEEMLTQSSVPVTSRIEVPEQLPPHVETAVYFVVAEALTNVAKHSGATGATVSVVADPSGVKVRVEDDGVGGAHPAKGLGLAGLRQRLAAVDGTLEIVSPDGVGTTLVARIPA
ncbi:sensor histidine kinase [Nocardioides sp. MAH-18]|uniref:histidine kinase n=1 Tax=Nocardioides agri TaxID=2682843 RepID=A0A6L6XRZ0_9ACTN|nr:MULTISPECIES: sensor histidine kinase [unclassified Nocardioides]MBA2954435.1 sensor histidine kinase [Nocardioides sp. CGMCC 1.13656]MVQ49296.1 sensor histidine kinase [Nocardioides sp. MAH-18]